MIPRQAKPLLLEAASQYPAVTVTGPRQSGKTTLCRATFPKKRYVNLENLDQREFAKDDPRGFLASFPDGAILDEIQRAPDLLSDLQGVLDEKNEPGQFILTGSQQFEVMTAITQSLAGRTAMMKLLPLSQVELLNVGIKLSTDAQILNGFYPRLYGNDQNSTQALGNYLMTYVERDIRLLSAVRDLDLFQRFVRLCAGRVGQLLNLQSLGNDVGISQPTARHWLTLLEASYVVHLLRPWHTKISERQVKTPKLYFYDVGLAAFLLGAEKEGHIANHPLRGNLYENMVVMEALKYRYNLGKRSNLYFWRDAKGNEVDLFVENGPVVSPVEIKSGATIANDYFKSLRFVANKLPAHSGMSALVYDGSEKQMRTDVSVWRTQDVAEMMASLSA
ncbi:MAG: ATP-binding protein [Planctomycetes bacterium]|nr:ATP-binding protein [Planctomycetota bacterium]